MYYDTWLGGQYEFKIIELHKQYGPIIRISPWELRKNSFQVNLVVLLRGQNVRNESRFGDLVLCSYHSTFSLKQSLIQ